MKLSDAASSSDTVLRLLARLWSRRADVAIGVLLAVAGAAAAWFMTGLHEQIPLLTNAKADDVWFEGDIARVFSNMTDRFGKHSRSNVHPLFSLFALGYTYLLGALLHLSKLQVVRLMIATDGAVWITLMYSLLRLLSCRRFDSALFSLVGATGAAAIFWTAVPETYLIGSVTILTVLVIAAVGERGPIPAWLDICAAAGVLSITVTNWMMALASLVTRHRIGRAVQLASNSLVVVVLLWSIQKYFVPSATFFLDNKGEAKSLMPPEVLTTLRVFFLHSMVMPDFQVVPQELPSLWPQLSVQHASTWKLTNWGPIALAAWSVLLLMGGWAMATLRSLKRFRLVVVVALAGQIALHMVYGSETFLYTLDWVPLLVTMAALATLTRLRPAVLTVATVFVVAAAQHNWAELKFALDTVAANAALSP